MVDHLWLLRLSKQAVTRFCRLSLCTILLSAIVLPLNGGSTPVTPTESSNWENWDEGLPSFAPMLSLAANPEQPGTLYAGTYSLPSLWHSADGGETWAREDQPALSRPSTHPIYTILWDAGRQCWWAGTASGPQPASVLNLQKSTIAHNNLPGLLA